MLNSNQIRKSIGWIIIPLWTGSLCVVVASLMAGHWVSLPHPAQGSMLKSASEGELLTLETESQFFTFHFLYGDCPCSRRVLKQVLSRQPIENANERVVLIGNDSKFEKMAVDRNFDLDVVTPQELKSKYGIESAPLLVVTDGNGLIRYSGGYTSRKQGLDYQDREIISQTIRGEVVAGLPLYGCAVSKSLKAIVDPLNLKY
jgi:hypothetical protein